AKVSIETDSRVVSAFGPAGPCAQGPKAPVRNIKIDYPPVFKGFPKAAPAATCPRTAYQSA
ncbi:MAG: hypothetical protein LUQ44_07080, partial [Methanothrix sp.]|nr:hypothetical protein [Methanothrix sp.]